MYSFDAFIQSNQLSNFANTKKNISPDFSNLNDLDSQEYIALMTNFMSYLTASNVPLIITGICYLNLMYEMSPQHFKESFFTAICFSGLSMDDEDDYHQISSLLIMCDFELYKCFLRKESCSDNLEIQSDSFEKMNATKDYFMEQQWLKTYILEYSEFKRKLGI
jgi:hypothetical protein